MKKTLCVLIAILMCLSSLPLVSFAAADYAVNVTVDIAEHKEYWKTLDSALNNLDLGTITIKNAFGSLFKENAKITVECVDINGGVTKQTVDVFNSSTSTKKLTFTPSAPAEKIVVNYYNLNELYVIGSKILTLEELTCFTIDVDGYGSKSYTAEDAKKDLTTKNHTAKIGPFNIYEVKETLFVAKNIFYLGAEKLPEGYSFETDSYSFANTETTISEDLYKKAYGKTKGSLLYFANENAAHGLCYGMTDTTATLLKYPEALASFGAETISGLTAESASDLFDTDLATYIKYGYMYQFEPTVQESTKATKNDVEGLYNQVAAYLKSESDPVIINFCDADGKNAHSVLAIGAKETNDNLVILVNDSNTPDAKNELLITKNFSAWTYNGYSSANGYLTYTCPGEAFYEASLRIKNGSGIFGSDYVLVVSEGALTADADLIAISSPIGSAAEASDSAYYTYWLKDADKAATLTSLADENEITVSDLDSSVTVTLNNGEQAELCADDNGDSYAKLSSNEGNSKIIFTTSYEDTTTELIIESTAAASEITAVQTQQGITLNGVKDSTITLKKDGAILSEQETEDAEGNINIAYDKNGENEDLSVDYTPHSHTFEGSICTGCGYDKAENCFCMCHKDGFLNFVWQIISFIYKMFNIHAECVCGAAHF